MAGSRTSISSSVPGAIASTQPLFFSAETPSAAASLIDSAVTSTECRTLDEAVKLTVHVRTATARQRIMFAFYSPSVGERLAFALQLRTPR